MSKKKNPYESFKKVIIEKLLKFDFLDFFQDSRIGVNDNFLRHKNLFIGNLSQLQDVFLTEFRDTIQGIWIITVHSRFIW